jgi:hypothetical protein
VFWPAIKFKYVTAIYKRGQRRTEHRGAFMGENRRMIVALS